MDACIEVIFEYTRVDLFFKRQRKKWGGQKQHTSNVYVLCVYGLLKVVAAPNLFMIYICKYVEICKVSRKELHQFGSPGLGTTWRVKKPHDPDSTITSLSAVLLNKEDSLT